MFRANQDSDLSPSKFSVGSIIKGGDQRWLIVGRSNQTVGKHVLLVDLSNFTITGCTDVQDLNFLTEHEVRDLVGSTIGRELNWAFSDFEFDPKGLK